MALENPALNERSFQRGIEEAGTEPRAMSAAGTYAITGLLFVIVVAAAAFGWSQVEIVTVGGQEERLSVSDRSAAKSVGRNTDAYASNISSKESPPSG
jgi:hypothetical protein